LATTLNKLIDTVFCSDKWNIGYVNQTPDNLIETQKINNTNVAWLKESSADYAADPFVLVRNKTVLIFYENLRKLFEKGTINLIKDFDVSDTKKVKGITPEKIHLSYPYIFKEDNKTYCIPETAAASEISLYEVAFEPEVVFKKNRTLVAGQPFVDSSIVKHNDKYWLFTSVKKKPGQFFIYHADALDGEFHPHKLNPVITDKKSYRNAGMIFSVDNQLYRPTQNLEKKYGGSIMINHIIELTETEFSSESKFEILPFGPYHEGIHNISLSDNLIVFDGKRRYFSLGVPFKKALRRLIYYTEKAVPSTKA